MFLTPPGGYSKIEESSQNSRVPLVGPPQVFASRYSALIPQR